MTRVYVGTYTKHGTSEGIYAYELEPATGALRLVQTVGGVGDPAYLAFGPGGRMLYLGHAPDRTLTGIIDENGNHYATWTYDSQGRATSSQHAGGADLTKVAYNDTDGSRTVTYPLGAQFVYKFTTMQNAPKVTELDHFLKGVYGLLPVRGWLACKMR